MVIKRDLCLESHPNHWAQTWDPLFKRHVTLPQHHTGLMQMISCVYVYTNGVVQVLSHSTSDVGSAEILIRKTVEKSPGSNFGTEDIFFFFFFFLGGGGGGILYSLLPTGQPHYNAIFGGP